MYLYPSAVQILHICNVNLACMWFIPSAISRTLIPVWLKDLFLFLCLCFILEGGFSNRFPFLLVRLHSSLHAVGISYYFRWGSDSTGESNSSSIVNFQMSTVYLWSHESSETIRRVTAAALWCYFGHVVCGHTVPPRTKCFRFSSSICSDFS